MLKALIFYEWKIDNIWNDLEILGHIGGEFEIKI